MPRLESFSRHLQMRTIRVVYEDPSYNRIGSINGCNESIIRHYVGQSFNFGDRFSGDKDKMVKCIAVEFLDIPHVYAQAL